MSRSRRLGARVLKAVASTLRLQVLNMLFDKGPLSYTEIMNILRLNPSRDAGRFAYHLKFLIKADLVEPDPETKKYRLTDLGRMLVEVAETIEEHSFKRRKMMVRTSRLAMEEFDRNKIAEALVKEANVPKDLAQKIARETEGRLLEVKTKYLTAPLIREFVNSILIEKGLEEYRHKLTRLGLPVHDVTKLIRAAGGRSASANMVHELAGDSVIEEYTLLNVLPRDIADAHLSGSLHLNNLGVWILQPNEFAHDMRFFLRHGLQFARPELAIASSQPPKTLEAALHTISNLLRITATETSGEQLLDYFNVFLSPFIQKTEPERARENLRLFVLDMNQSLLGPPLKLPVSIGIEPSVPKFIEHCEAAGPGGNKAGTYGEYADENRFLASVLLDVVLEESKHKPLLQPSLIVKLRPETLKSKESESVLALAHQLAAERGLPYFANLASSKQASVSYTATGSRFANDWKGDWELDTLRMGTIDSVVTNLPRIAYETQKIDKFYRMLDEQLEMAVRSLEIKYQTIKLRCREGLLPFLTNKFNGEQYCRLENFTRLVSFVGLNETIETIVGKMLYEDSSSIDLAEQIVKHIHDSVSKTVRKPETRPLTALVPCPSAARRLALLDVERFGWAKVHPRGTKEHPFYTDMSALPDGGKVALDHRIKIEERIQQLAPGGHLTLFPIDKEETDSSELLAVSRRLCSESKIGLYSFSRDFSYCGKCKKILPGSQVKCPLCGSVDSVINYRKVSAKYKRMAN